GLDVSGVIVELGQNTSPWKVGDRVLCHGNMLSPYGGFAEFSLQRVETLLLHPKLDSVVAAASPCAGWTAWQALVDKLRAGERESLLIFGASGGVGTFAVQLAAQFGVRQIFAACSAETHDYVRALGATRAI